MCSTGTSRTCSTSNWLRDTQHRGGHLDVGDFLHDRLQLLVQNIDDLTNVCGTGASRTGTMGTWRSQSPPPVCCSNLPCGRTSARGGGRTPLSSSSYNWKSSVPPATSTANRLRGASCVASAVAVLFPREEWRTASATDGDQLVAKPLTEPSLSPPLFGAPSSRSTGVDHMKAFRTRDM